MTENKLLSKSKKSRFITIIIFLGIILFSWIVYLTYVNIQPKIIYEERTKFFGISILVFLILFCIYYYLNMKRVYIYNDFIEIKTLLKTRKYFFSEFKTYYSEKFKGKYNSWTEYYLITNTDEKITFIDSEYSNFYSFFNDIERKIKVDKNLNAELSKPKFLKYALICALISGLFFLFSSNFYTFKPISEKDIVYITDVLQENIKLKEGSKGSRTIEIHLENYPIFTFKDSGYNEYLMNNFSKGDTIKIGIASEVFKKKIEHTLPLSFKEKYLNYSTIFIEQFKTKEGNSYYNLIKENQRMEKNSTSNFIVFSIFGSVLLFISIYLIIKSKNSL